MNKKVWVRGFVFISFFLLVFCSFGLYAQEKKEDMNAIMEEEDIFYEVEDEEFLEEIGTEEEIESVEEESLQPFKEVEEKEAEEKEAEEKEAGEKEAEEKEAVATEEKEDVSVQREEEMETEEELLLESETEETEAEEKTEKIAEPEEMGEGEEKRYTIRTWNFDKDCLWNIADHFYKNPWEWQKIWKANSYIENPDLIYEGNELIIPGVTEEVVKELKLPETAIVEEEPVFRKTKETEEEKDVASVDRSVLPEKKEEEEFLREEISTLPSPVEEEEEEEIEEVEEQVVVAKAGRYEDKEDTFIAPLNWEYDGIIIRSKERKMLLSAYSDFVFIDCGKDKGVVYGMRFNVYRKGKTVKHPRTKKILGIKIKKVGVLEVKQDIQENNATAQIINAREPIKIGDLIKIQQ